MILKSHLCMLDDGMIGFCCFTTPELFVLSATIQLIFVLEKGVLPDLFERPQEMSAIVLLIAID